MTSSTMFCMENSFLKPSSGLSRLNFGLRFLVANRKRVCMPLPRIPRSTQTSRNGSSDLASVTANRLLSVITLPLLVSVIVPAMPRKRIINCAIDTIMPSRKILSAKNEPAKVTRLATSLLCSTLPSFRWSLRFLGVAFSVLEPESAIYLTSHLYPPATFSI